LDLGKFRDNNGSWKEHIQWLEEDILKVDANYILQEDQTERGKVRVERE
jgi:hypothetical protein